jgi:phosphate transport system ATP-binding protein
MTAASPYAMTQTRTVSVAAARNTDPGASRAGLDAKLLAEKLSVYYGDFRALYEVSFAAYDNRITAIIGPSGCGKSTLLRSFNRMNDSVVGTHIDGRITLDGEDIYAPDIDPVKVRRRVGMVFQKPNPFAKSIYENMAFGIKLYSPRMSKSELDGRVETALRSAAVWDDVQDKLQQPGTSLSGGQQQRLCIARAIAAEPEALLMDEPCSALDPVSTLKIEELMQDLKKTYTILIVTHNMQQAARVSDYTAMMMMREDRAGELIEFDETEIIFTKPKDRRTEDYVSGRFG